MMSMPTTWCARLAPATQTATYNRPGGGTTGAARPALSSALLTRDNQWIGHLRAEYVCTTTHLQAETGRALMQDIKIMLESVWRTALLLSL